MNIGIDFNTKTIKAATLVSGYDIEDCKIFETKNVLVFSNGNILAGDDGFNKFLTEKDSTIYDLDQIIEWNGLIVNKQQISAEKCLSVIFTQLLNKIKTHTQNNEIGFICISIPYDKYYYWHSLMKKAFSLIGIEKVRIISQPAAFFGQPSINGFQNRLGQESLRKENEVKYLHKQALKKYEELPWLKKTFSKKPKYKGGIVDKSNYYLFVSVSQDNTNVSLIDYGEDVLGIVNTQYTNSITRRKIENSILDYFITEISKDSRNFNLKDQKMIARLSDLVDEFVKTQQTGDVYELNLPYFLCEDGEYRTLDTKIILKDLYDFLTSMFTNLVNTIKEFSNREKIENMVIICDSFIKQNLKDILPKVFEGTKVIFESDKSLAIGAFNYSRVMTGENRAFLALEVVPFSVLVRLREGEFVELVEKDTTLPTISKEHCFTLAGKSKAKFVEVHLTTKEGALFQSLNVWKIKIDDWKAFRVQVDIGVNLEISLKAYAHDTSKPYYENESTLRILRGEKPPGEQLVVQGGSTFSFSGAGFEVGIKGKDIRQYILNQFNYLSAVLESKETAIFEPDESFYTMLKDGDPFKALRYLGHFLKLKSLPDVEIADSKFFEEQGIGGFISGSKISIPKYFTKDPHGFGYVLAHELAHYILIHEEQIILDDEQENEILTEIFVIYSGMGKLFLNGFKSKDIESSSLHARGYLDEKILKYIHEIYISRFNIKLPDYRRNLTNEAVKTLDELASK